MKFVIFYDTASEVEKQINDWLAAKLRAIKHISQSASGTDIVISVWYEEDGDDE